MTYFLCLIFGLAPSIIWLLFFLRKDVHPESNRMIILVFLLGMAVAPLTALFECLPVGLQETGGLKCLTSLFSEFFPPPWGSLLYLFLILANPQSRTHSKLWNHAILGQVL